MKPKCTNKVRELLVELDQAFQRYHSESKIIADRNTDNSTAMEVGASNMGTKAWIFGIAWRINKASKGEK